MISHSAPTYPTTLPPPLDPNGHPEIKRKLPRTYLFIPLSFLYGEGSWGRLVRFFCRKRFGGSVGQSDTARVTDGGSFSGIRFLQQSPSQPKHRPHLQRPRWTSRTERDLCTCCWPHGPLVRVTSVTWHKPWIGRVTLGTGVLLGHRRPPLECLGSSSQLTHTLGSSM